jgi:hypothetical protein
MLSRVRAVDCRCGQTVQDEDDDEPRSDEDVRSRVAERGYEPPAGEPPWAY